MGQSPAYQSWSFPRWLFLVTKGPADMLKDVKIVKQFCCKLGMASAYRSKMFQSQLRSRKDVDEYGLTIIECWFQRVSEENRVIWLVRFVYIIWQERWNSMMLFQIMYCCMLLSFFERNNIIIIIIIIIIFINYYFIIIICPSPL